MDARVAAAPIRERAGAASALRARVLVNCGGLYADAVDATLRSGRSTFAVAPRRGTGDSGRAGPARVVRRPRAARRRRPARRTGTRRLRVAHGPRRRDRRAHGRALLGKDRARRRSLFTSRSDPVASGKTGARRLELRRDSRPLRRAAPGRQGPERLHYPEGRRARHRGGHPVDGPHGVAGHRRAGAGAGRRGAAPLRGAHTTRTSRCRRSTSCGRPTRATSARARWRSAMASALP